MDTIYQDIGMRTGGNVYIGVVGPVRTGKSTLIKRMMEELVIPGIEDPYRKERARDELPQSGSGKTIMTSEPKFVPEEAVEISPDGTTRLRVRLIDSVGYMIPGAVGAPMSAGTNRLIQKGEAKPVFSAEDSLEEYEHVYPGRLRSRNPTELTNRKTTEIHRKVPKKPAEPLEEVDKPAERAYSTFEAAEAAFTDDEKEVLRVLGAEGLHPDELAERTGIPARRILSALTLLEMRGWVKSAPGHLFTAAADHPVGEAGADSRH